MDWRAQLASLLDHVERLPNPRWLTAAATCAALVLLLALIVVFMHHLRLRRRLAERDEGAQVDIHPPLSGWEDRLPPISLEGEGRAFVDRTLPRSPRRFLLAVAGLVAGCWALGLALASDVPAFLASREWQLQPLYLAVHFITLRLFANVFTRNFMAGVADLELSSATARRRMRLILGPVGALLALALAAPFGVYDYRVLFSGNDAAKTDAEGLGRAADQLLVAMWCVEWFIMAFIWVLLVGFVLLARWAVGEHRFRSPIEVVLHERQYRPFLQMSAQGATIMLGFFLANAAYVWYTGAELSDYIGVGITLVLLVVGFVPPLLQLRGKVDRAVNEQMSSMRRRLASAASRDHASAAAAAGQAPTVQALEGRLDEALVMLRISYLERLYGDLGYRETMDILVKLMVPAGTMVWHVLRYLRWVS